MAPNSFKDLNEQERCAQAVPELTPYVCEEPEEHILKMPIWRLLKYCALRIYIICWHELSMDPAVRLSPYTQAPPDEVILPEKAKRGIRMRRIYFTTIHLLAVWGLYYCITGNVSIYTIIWTAALGLFSSIGITAGAHRLWSHHSYKANWPLRMILMVLQTIGIQYSIYNWVHDHRIHHKYTDTDSDPHNSTRGFFFSHIGWLLILRHPNVASKKAIVDLADIKNDSVVMFQRKYYLQLVIVMAYIIPTLVPWYFWEEKILISFLVCVKLRHVLTLHGTFLINSAAHMWGSRPYDKNIRPTENMIVSVTTCGDGWHNYHHVFPWDYKNAELLNYKLNLSTLFVDLFAKIGWAYDLKSVSQDVAAIRAKRTGDGTHHSHIWGWGDKDLTKEDKISAVIAYPSNSTTHVD